MRASTENLISILLRRYIKYLHSLNWLKLKRLVDEGEE